MADVNDAVVIFEPEHQRFVIQHKGRQAGYAKYTQVSNDAWDFDGTKIDPEFEGKGFGTKLVDTALDHAEAEGKQIEASCWFVDVRMKKRANR